MKIIKKSPGFLRCLCGIAFICLLLVVAGCHYREEAVIAVPEGKVVFDRIAVIPFRQIVPEDARSGAVSCPLCGLMVDAVPSPGSPETLLESLFLKQLDKKSKHQFGLIAGERVAGVFRRISATSLKAPLRQVIREVGSELGAEGVVSGYVYRFRERKGVSYAVEQPASVAFEIHLLRVSDGALVWKGYFDRTQSSLMEDLLQVSSFYRGRGRWVTAEELAEEGLEQIMKTFPGLP
ncbi:MAG: hypothetical protein KJ936_07705 [Proteobacteria bacterium]|nr:hypothetical protein [Pseudomonadota bacterium]MBU2227537.1 hypothetical protein [Pseudomonadota bacterium]MBU2260774.1 hypothetical protein [Pseudomonadota bacterium]